ncbi:unnamed protein product [Symbiodinium sp. CCMP2456]|nr:unnamed protein product [Symbiodinium sp. CCMP2456]
MLYRADLSGRQRAGRDGSNTGTGEQGWNRFLQRRHRLKPPDLFDEGEKRFEKYEQVAAGADVRPRAALSPTLKTLLTEVERVDDEPPVLHGLPTDSGSLGNLAHGNAAPANVISQAAQLIPARLPPHTTTQLRCHVHPAFVMAVPWRGLAYASSLAGRYVLGDGLTQRLLERREHDWRRSCLFGSFGAVMGAPAYLFYAEFPTRVLSKLVEGRWRMVAAMIGVDALIFMPLVYLPCFYTFREAIYNRLPWLKSRARLASERMVVQSSKEGPHALCAVCRGTAAAGPWHPLPMHTGRSTHP